MSHFIISLRSSYTSGTPNGHATTQLPHAMHRGLRADCTTPPDVGRRHDALFAGFWWSHVPLQQLEGFLAASVAAVAPRALIAFLDNRYVEGSSTPVARRDAEGNAYQLRTLEDGSRHEVLKNFPSASELIRRTVKHGSGAKVENFEHYWLLSFRANA